MLAPKALHKRSISSVHHDLEKNPGDDDTSREGFADAADDDPRPRSNRADYLVVVLAILVVGSVLNFMILSSATRSSVVTKIGGWVPGFGPFAGQGSKLDPRGEAGDAMAPDVVMLNEVEEEADLKIGITGGKSTMKIDANDNGLKNLLNVDNIDPNDLDEWEKFANELSDHAPDADNSLQAIESEIARTKHDANQQAMDLKPSPQMDLAEILSINPIVLLMNEENMSKQEQVKQILQTLNITPELKLVNLKKHPHYQEIFEYLKTYRVHNDASNGGMVSDYQRSQYIHNTLNDVDDIPRLFIGGMPVADYNDIVLKYDTNQLHDVLTHFGQGLIKLQI